MPGKWCIFGANERHNTISHQHAALQGVRGGDMPIGSLPFSLFVPQSFLRLQLQGL
jgi:hypothetical protein